MGLTPGARFGHYEITGIVGAGGMGEVYRARDTRLKRDVALKVLPDSLAGDPERLARFAREAEMLAALNHPHIATIYGLEEADPPADSGQAAVRALVMELVEGDTLADRIGRGAIPLEDALPIARQIAEALEAAHAQGIVHRDLKPANVKVTDAGRVKVLDFGLARAADGRAAQAGSATMSPTITSPAYLHGYGGQAMTQAGIILGTAAYMSPEQAKGKAVDSLADIWAFGVVLFEMLAGQRPFAGEDVADVLASVLARDPQLARLPDTVPASIRTLIRACLQKDPRQRLHHAADVRLALDGAFDSGRDAAVPSSAPASRLTTPRAAAVLVASIAAAAALGAAVAWTLKPAAPVAPTRFVHPLGAATFTRAGRPLLALSPDARRLAYVADYQLFVREMRDPTARPIPGTREGQGPSSPAFSPDGDSIAYWSEQAIKRIPVSGGTPVVLAEAALPLGLSWGADGTIVYAQSDGIWRMRDNGTSREHIVRVAAGERMHAPQMMPGSGAMLFAVTTEAGAEAWDRASIVVQELRTGTRVEVRRGAFPRYVNTGHLLYVIGNTLFAAAFDPERPEELGEPVQVATGVQRSIGPPIGIAQYAASDSGGLAYVGGLAGQGVDLVVTQRSGEARVLPESAGDNLFPRLSPDDTRIAVQRGRGDDANVWIYDLVRMQWIPLTSEGGERPLWNRAGDSVTFLRDGELWQVPADGGAERRLPGTKLAGNRGPYDWSPGDDVLLYGSNAAIRAYYPGRGASDRPPGPEVVVPAGGPVNMVGVARFSSDGKAIAYLAVERNSDPYVYLAPFPFMPGAQRRVTIDAAVAPVWGRAPGRATQELFVTRNNALHSIAVTDTTPVLRWLNRVDVLPASLSRILSDEGNANYDAFRDGAFVTVAPRADPQGVRAGQQIDVALHWIEELRKAAP